MRSLKCVLLLFCILSQHLVVSAPSSSSLVGKIKHIIVLMEENRSFDHFFGWYPGVDGLTGNEYNLVNSSDPNSEKVYIQKTSNYVAPCDPDHSTPATAAKIYGVANAAANRTTDGTMSGFAEWERIRGNTNTNYCEVMNTFTPADLPVMMALAEEFVLFDRFFCAHPGPTWPNRLFMLTGTSAGLTETGTWYQNQVGQLFPQPSIFDQLDAEGFTWRNYFNDTPWELMLGSLAHNPQNLVSMEQFYLDASEGNLPNFAWINPRSGVNISLAQGSNDDHPDHDVAIGEQYYKDIYEALRASPQWNETLFIITYDEHGGFYDHVAPPINVPAPGDDTPSFPDPDVTFDRLGIRIPTLLISPWLPKGLILSEAPEEQKPFPDSEYTLTSIIATVRKLLNMTSGPLTKRDAWSATFEQVFNLTEPRDTPEHLPAAPPPSASYSVENEAALPVNGLQEYILAVHANVLGEDYPSHITTQGEVSEFLQKKFNQHKDLTHKWKSSKQQNWAHVQEGTDTDYDIIVAPSKHPGWVSTDWIYNANTSVPYITLSIMTDLCMEFDADKLTVDVSVCYPSAAPVTNRDPEQHWVWGNDALVRPYGYDNLCLATNILSGSPALYLATCNFDDIAQHFAWQGGMVTALGHDSGSIGWSIYSVGLVNAAAKQN